MRLKSAYRGKPANQIPIEDRNIPAIKIDGEKVEPDIAVHAERGGEPESDKAVDAALETALKADEAANTLRRQIEALRQSEELQRQQAAAMVAQAPPTREQLLAHWKNQGTSEAEIKFLEQNPELIDIPELTAAAATAAQQQGHKRGTEAHMQVTRELFYKHLNQIQAQAEAAQPRPEFFMPPPAPKSAPSPASYTSAPVSREVPTGGYREPRPSQVRLSADELQIAKTSGISATEYARNKIRLAKEKASGERQ